jgi:hypothetical protein
MSEVDLETRAARIRALAGMGVRAAPAAAVAIQAVVAGHVARGEGSDGKPWPRTAAGDVPLRNAAAAVTVRAVGSTIVLRVTGPEARHDTGRVRGGIRRAILPVAALPADQGAAIGRAVDDVFRRTLAGGRP